jgi:meso-butanediol dehydrogenase/(S,S)-butanediol dehydrogenase/diacetyl reductase
MRLKEKVCVITGGGSGIGRATALLFAQEGARLVVADKRNAQKVAAECANKGAQAIAVEADVAVAADVRRMIEAAVERFRRLDVLVNNAGYGITGSVVETDEEDWDALMAVNVRGVFLCSKYAIPAMKRSGGGAIVNTASVVAAVGVGNRAAYCASKGAVAALTRAIAIDHVGEGIRCNAIAPGTIDTPYFNDILKAKRRSGRHAQGAGGAPAPRPAGHARGNRGRNPVSGERRKSLRHRHHPYLGRRHDRAIAGSAAKQAHSVFRMIMVPPLVIIGKFEKL